MNPLIIFVNQALYNGGLALLHLFPVIANAWPAPPQELNNNEVL